MSKSILWIRACVAKLMSSASCCCWWLCYMLKRILWTSACVAKPTSSASCIWWWLCYMAKCILWTSACVAKLTPTASCSWWWLCYKNIFSIKTSKYSFDRVMNDSLFRSVSYFAAKTKNKPFPAETAAFWQHHSFTYWGYEGFKDLVLLECCINIRKNVLHMWQLFFRAFFFVNFEYIWYVVLLYLFFIFGKCIFCWLWKCKCWVEYFIALI